MNRLHFVTTTVAGVYVLIMCMAAAQCAWCASIAEVKSSGDWMQVTVEGIVTYVEPLECYIEAPNRSGGIRVIGPADGINVGDAVVAYGTFAVIDGEPAVTDAAIYLQGTPNEIKPFAMNNRAVGGASKWSPQFIWDYVCERVYSDGEWICRWKWGPAGGANNTGLLVTTWGKVRSTHYSPVTDTKWIYIDDGSRTVSDCGDTGVLVYTNAEVDIGDFVSVTGVSSTEPSFDNPSRLIRVVRTREAGDVRIVKASSPPEHPFSDEFDSPTLDPRWVVIPGLGSVSLTDRPGWLAITAYPSDNLFGISPQVIQGLSGDWDLEIKVQVELRQEMPFWHSLRIELIPPPKPSFNFNPVDSTTLAYTSHGCMMLYNCGTYSSKVMLCNKFTTDMIGDTCYFRFRRRGEMIYGNLSFDGQNYLPQDVPVKTPEYCFLTLWMRSARERGSLGVPFTVYFDYVRFTPISSRGGQ